MQNNKITKIKNISNVLLLFQKNDKWTIILEQIDTWGQQFIFFDVSNKQVKASTTNHLRGFGGPGVLKSDPACILHHN